MSDAPKTWPFPKGIDPSKIIAGTVKGTAPAKPTVYLLIEESSIAMSAYPCDHPLWDTNHIEVSEPRQITFYAPATLNILRNVLEQAGIEVVEE